MPPIIINYPDGYNDYPVFTDFITPVEQQFLNGIGFAFHSITYTLGLNPQGGFNTVAERFGNFVPKTGGNYQGNVGFNYYRIEYAYLHNVYLPGGVPIAGIPVGVIVIWSGSIVSIPDGWALCDGSNGTPDLRDRFVVGAGDEYVPGDNGGEERHTLVAGEIPGHTHGAVGNHVHKQVYDTVHTLALGPWDWYSPRGDSNDGADTRGAGGHTHASFGGYGSHENRPPYFSLAYIMKV